MPFCGCTTLCSGLSMAGLLYVYEVAVGGEFVTNNCGTPVVRKIPYGVPSG